MSLYAEATSCAQGEELRFRLLEGGGGPIRVEDVPSGRVIVEDESPGGPAWTLKVGDDWPSSLYRAIYHDTSAYFVVRSVMPSSPILVSIPFPTWEAYNRPGVPGEGLYQSEQPDRAVKVTFDRPGAGPQIEEWELGLLRWLGPAGYPVDYCSALDLHGGLDFLTRYRLLLINGHDEYWSWEMRDTVEEFARRGGNIAIFSGNTCWWQVRFEDDLRTMVCYRDATADPMAATDPGRVTVEWPSDPVNRPENTLTGLSFRNGAGCWVDSRVMSQESYTARFAGHWVFEGTGLADGDTFGRGAIGYETDAADLEWVAGVPRATGRDGTPPSFVVLATADLSHWRRYGKGGAATMGVHRLGAGTIFNAGTINWGNTLHDPVLATITRNVLDRLSHRPAAPTWDTIGPTPTAAHDGALGDAPDAAPTSDAVPVAPGSTAHRPADAAPQGAEDGVWDAGRQGAADGPFDVARNGPAGGPFHAPRRSGVGDPSARSGVRALVCCENRLYAACSDGTLAVRDVSGQNLPWEAVGETDAIALAAPREAHGGPPAGLYGVAPDGTIRYRDPTSAPQPWQDAPVPQAWQDVSRAPEGTIALAAVDEGLFAVTSAGELWHLPIRRLDAHDWRRVGPAAGVVSLTAINGRLFAIAADRILVRSAERHESGWSDLGPAAGRTALAATAGRLIGAGHDGLLHWRSLTA
ncbi:N,N-dimethylformamidase beta subunit family domain-containing protein [Nonomuraea sp. NPDC049400]|uniref:N,N-dimethylformamidase beta subunit family domain-containing protein n=1 Tax=Nonomuraea sp. NPDC049400 TaxID=3364352 RepID=UPI00378BDB2E